MGRGSSYRKSEERKERQARPIQQRRVYLVTSVGACGVVFFGAESRFFSRVFPSKKEEYVMGGITQREQGLARPAARRNVGY